uniref:Uncharacterized protein n=1 Tax=Anguilla anguilla TaxID=7936 RepID=A0A0E9WDP3_ANGAN
MNMTIALCRPCLWFSHRLNSQVCVHLCNEGFMHCSPTMISLCVVVGRLFLLTESDHVLVDSLSHPEEGLPCFRHHLPTSFPMDLNADTAPVAVLLKRSPGCCV